jgi:hypothetical protein
MSAIFPCFESDRTREEIVEPACLQCGASLVMHQPDPQLPHRLLAVCEVCKEWYVSDPYGLLMTPIPVEGERRPRRPKPRP